MSDNARKDPGDEPDEAALSARLRQLGERLGQKRASRPPEHAGAPTGPSDASGMARGLRLSSELIGGIIGGAVIGWLIDRWLGIAPWGLIVFVLLGFAAGMLNLMRATGGAERGDDQKIDR